MNIFTVTANLGKDMELRYTPNGKCIGVSSVPVESGYGEHKKTAWVQVKLFGERAEKLAPYLLKGTKHTFSGEFQLDEWEKDGVTNKMPVLIVDKITLGSKLETSQGASKSHLDAQADHVAKQKESPFEDDDMSKIPF